MSKTTHNIDEVIDGPFPGMFVVIEPVIVGIQHAHRLVAWMSMDGSKCAVVGRSLRQQTRNDDVEKAIKDTVAMVRTHARTTAYDRIGESHVDTLYAAIMALPESRRENSLFSGKIDDWQYFNAEDQKTTQRQRIAEALGYAIRHGHFGGNDLPEHPRDAFTMATKFQNDFSGSLSLDKSFIDIFDAVAKDITPDLDNISTCDEVAFATAALDVENRWLRRAGGAKLYVKDIREAAESIAAECRSMTGVEISPPSP